MQPVEESAVMEPVQEVPVMQPAEYEVDEGNEDTMPRADDDSQSFLNPVSEEDTLNSHEDEGRDQKNDNGETEDHIGDIEHEKFDQELNGTPEALEVEIEYGMGVFIDYIVFDDQRVVENPMKYYNGGPLELQSGGQ
jgi:hypothetical protein